MEENFIVKTNVDSDTTVVTTDLSEEAIRVQMDEASTNYARNSQMFSSVFEGDKAVGCATLEEVARLAVDPQNDIGKTRKIARIVDTYINKNYLLGLVDTAIRSNLNTKYRVSYCSANGRNKAKRLEEAKAAVQDMLNQIDVKKLIRISIPTTFNHGNFFFYLETKEGKHTIHIFPLSVARVAPYRCDGEPILMIDMDELRSRLEHNLPKRKGGKAYFFEKYEKEIVMLYPDVIVEAFKNREKYAILDSKRTGVMRAGEDGDGSCLYGISQMLRALSDVIVLDGFTAVDDAASKVKAKNILVQLMRKETLGADGTRSTFKEAAYAHGELCRAVKNKTCVYTATASTEDVKWIEPKSSLINVDNVTIYENRVLSTLGIGFLAHGGTATAVTANISLKQLLRHINYISEQLEHILEKFSKVLLEDMGIPVEFAPTFNIIDSEQLDAELRLELAKFLYGTLGASRKTVFEAIDIDVEDESDRRKLENETNINDIFYPYSTTYNKSGDTDENEIGRPADKDSIDPDKQEQDKERNNM